MMNRKKWSSAAAYTGGADETGLLDLRAWRREFSPAQWKQQLRRSQDDDELHSLRLSTHTDRPLATDNLLSKLETRLGRRLRPRPVGRPRKTAKVRRRRKKSVAVP